MLKTICDNKSDLWEKLKPQLKPVFRSFALINGSITLGIIIIAITSFYSGSDWSNLLLNSKPFQLCYIILNLFAYGNITTVNPEPTLNTIKNCFKLVLLALGFFILIIFAFKMGSNLYNLIYNFLKPLVEEITNSSISTSPKPGNLLFNSIILPAFQIFQVLVKCLMAVILFKPIFRNFYHFITMMLYFEKPQKRDSDAPKSPDFHNAKQLPNYKVQT